MNRESGIGARLLTFNTDHKVIGIQYLSLRLFSTVLVAFWQI